MRGTCAAAHERCAKAPLVTWRSLPVDGVRDDREDVVDLRAEQGECHEGDDNDPGHYQRVLRQALTAVVHLADRRAYGPRGKRKGAGPSAGASLVACGES